METPTDIEVAHISSDNETACLSWILGDARYHVWISVKNAEIITCIGRDKPTLYKNPLLDVVIGSARWFETRYLDPFATANNKAVQCALEALKTQGLIDKAMAVKNEEERKEQKRCSDIARQRKIEEASPELYAVVKAIAEFWEHGQPLSPNAQIGYDDRTIHQMVKDAMSKAGVK